MINQLREYCSQQFSIINRNLTRYYLTPARPLGRRTVVRTAGNPPTVRVIQPQQQQQQQQQQQPQQQQQQQPPQPQQLIIPQEYVDPTAKLGKPRTLLMLWHECLYGLDGNKPASNFTHLERGRVKQKYSRRLNYWTVMVQLCNRGLTDLAAIDLLTVRRCYGNNSSVTKLCDILCRAKAEGYHPNLGLQNQQQNNRGAQQRSRRQDV